MNNLWVYLLVFLVVDSTLVASVWLDRRRKPYLGSKKTAGLGVRILAQLVDGYVAIFVGWLVFGVLFLLNDRIFQLQFVEQRMESDFWVIFCVISGFVYVLHNSISTTLFGKTLGKKLLRIKVVSVDGGLAGGGVVLKRLLLYALFIITVGYAFVDLFRNEQKQGIHDRLCGTKVIYTGTPSFIIIAIILFLLHIIGLMKPA